MDGIESLQGTNTRRVTRRFLPWASFMLCLLLVGTVLSADILSLVGSQVYPQADGTKTLKGKSVTVDISHIDKGYFMVRHNGSSKRLKCLVKYGGETLQYDVNGDGEYETFPLQMGNGKYTVEVYEQQSGDKYAKLFADSFSADMPDPNAAFLVPNQYVWYNANSEAVILSFTLCEGLTTDMEKARTLYDYVGQNVMYDYMKALTVQKGYLPDVDETLRTKMGICFDYSALLATMLRAQGIPTQLVIGNLVPENQYHAWNLALIDGQWRLMDATFYNRKFTPDDYAQERFY